MVSWEEQTRPMVVAAASVVLEGDVEVEQVDAVAWVALEGVVEAELSDAVAWVVPEGVAEVELLDAAAWVVLPEDSLLLGLHMHYKILCPASTAFHNEYKRP